MKLVKLDGSSRSVPIAFPVLKKDNRNKADNYRPVSLTSIIGKT